MWYAGCLAVLILFLMGSAIAAPVNIIFDTDMDTDVDDVGALAIIHALADRGEANVLAVIHSAPKPEGPICAQAVNAWYGREDVPVGWTDWPDLATSPVYAHYRKARAHILNIGSDYVPVIAATYRESKQDATPPIEDGVALYRKTLAAAEDGSVVICAVGQLAALAGLMESKADAHSDLDGPALVKKKTKLLVSMALSAIPEGRDGFNWRCDWPSAEQVINRWPTALAVMPIGAEILTGGPLVAQGDPANPCRNAYNIYVKDAHKSRSSWDLCAVLYAIRGAAPWFRERNGYRIQLDTETAISRWWKDPTSPQVLLEQTASDETIRDLLDDLLLQPPMQNK